MKKQQQFLYKTGILLFLRQVCLLRIIVSSWAVAAISVIWYTVRFGSEFAELCEFCGLDVFFFCLGNYSKEWGEIWVTDHYLIAALPFLVLTQQLIFYMDSNSCERIYYVGFRRGNMWKQAIHDFVRIKFIILSWLFCWAWTEKTIFSFLYGWTENSYFLGNGITLKEEFAFLCCMILRQAIIVAVCFLFAYGMIFAIGLVWAAVAMIGVVMSLLLLGFSGINSPFVLNAVSAQTGKPLIVLIVLLLIIFLCRKYIKRIYFK